MSGLCLSLNTYIPSRLLLGHRDRTTPAHEASAGRFGPLPRPRTPTSSPPPPPLPPRRPVEFKQAHQSPSTPARIQGTRIDKPLVNASIANPSRKEKDFTQNSLNKETPSQQQQQQHQSQQSQQPRGRSRETRPLLPTRHLSNRPRPRMTRSLDGTSSGSHSPHRHELRRSTRSSARSKSPVNATDSLPTTPQNRSHSARMRPVMSAAVEEVTFQAASLVLSPSPSNVATR
jgi:hypothetical protein